MKRRRVSTAQKRFELKNLVERRRLESIIRHYARAMNLASGVVRMAPEFEPIINLSLNDIEALSPEEIWKRFPKFDPEKERLTRVYRCSEFCSKIRQSPKGNILCWYADLRYCREAFQKRHPILYRCHAGLLDFVAPIRIGSWHAANVYGGQIFSDLTEEELRKHFSKYLTGDKLLSPPMSLDNKAAKSLNTKSINEIRIAIELLEDIADQISRRATEHATRLVMQDISRKVVAESDMERGLYVFLEHTKRLIDFDSGSIWVIDPNGFNAPEKLNYGAIDWPNKDNYIQDAKKNGISIDEGLVGHIAKSRKSIRSKNREEIDKIAPKYEKSRKDRNLNSFCGVPVIMKGKLLGVWEIGSQREGAFDEDDEELLETLAAEAAVFIQAVLDRSELKQRVMHLELLRTPSHGTNDLYTLFDRAVEKGAYFLACKGVTIWLFNEDHSRITLEAASGPHKTYVKKHFYEVGEGLTGKVAQNGKIIRVKESYNQPDWKGKYRFKRLGEVPPGRVPLMIIPLDSRGERLGVVKFTRRPGHNAQEFTEEDEKIATSFCSQLAIEIQNLKLLDRLREQLINLSHSSINPLSAILSHAEVLAQENSQKRKNHSLGIITSEIERLSTMIRNRANFAKIQSNLVKPQIQSCNPAELISQTASLFELEAEDKGINIIKEIPDNALNIEIDPIMIRDVLNNLVSNAIQAILQKPKAKKKKINITLKIQNDNILIDIKDSGCGIPEVKRKSLFEPYQPSSSGGAGIGLAISKSYIEAHKGKLELLNTSPVRGTIFRISLSKKH